MLARRTVPTVLFSLVCLALAPIVINSVINVPRTSAAPQSPTVQTTPEVTALISCIADACWVGDEIGLNDGCPYRCTVTRGPNSNADLVMLPFLRGSWDNSENEINAIRSSTSRGQVAVVFITESPAHYQSLTDQRYMSLFNYSVGFRPSFDTWLINGVLHWGITLNGVRSAPSTDPPVPYSVKVKRPLISMFISNCRDVKNKRDLVIKALADNGVSLASYGKCLHNAEPWVSVENFSDATAPEWTKAAAGPDDWRLKVFISAHHMFVFSAENSDCDWYHSEKIYHALLSGSIPVYLGSPTVRDIVPNNSVIVARDYATPKELADYLLKVSQDEKLHNSYHEWRKRSLDPHMQKLLDYVNGFQAGKARCEVCKAAHHALPNQRRVPIWNECLKPLWT